MNNNELPDRKKYQDKPSFNKFTIIELIIVIAIIMILAGLLLPALKKARDTGKQISCQNKVKQLGLCVSMYASDNNFFLTCGGGSGSAHGWEEKLMPYLQANGTLPTSPYFHCPSSREGCIAYPNLPNRWMGYGMNVYITSNYNSAYAGHRPNANLTWIEHPVQLLVISDGELYDYDGTGRETLMFQSYTLRVSPTDVNINSMTWRHRNGTNILFADGHVQWYKRDGAYLSIDTGDPDPIPTGIEFRSGYTYGVGEY